MVSHLTHNLPPHNHSPVHNHRKHRERCPCCIEFDRRLDDPRVRAIERRIIAPAAVMGQSLRLVRDSDGRESVDMHHVAAAIPSLVPASELRLYPEIAPDERKLRIRVRSEWGTRTRSTLLAAENGRKMKRAAHWVLCA